MDYNCKAECIEWNQLDFHAVQHYDVSYSSVCWSKSLCAKSLLLLLSTKKVYYLNYCISPVQHTLVQIANGCTNFWEFWSSVPIECVSYFPCVFLFHFPHLCSSVFFFILPHLCSGVFFVFFFILPHLCSGVFVFHSSTPMQWCVVL